PATTQACSITCAPAANTLAFTRGGTRYTVTLGSARVGGGAGNALSFNSSGSGTGAWAYVKAKLPRGAANGTYTAAAAYTPAAQGAFIAISGASGAGVGFDLQGATLGGSVTYASGRVTFTHAGDGDLSNIEIEFGH